MNNINRSIRVIELRPLLVSIAILALPFGYSLTDGLSVLFYFIVTLVSMNVIGYLTIVAGINEDSIILRESVLKKQRAFKINTLKGASLEYLNGEAYAIRIESVNDDRYIYCPPISARGRLSEILALINRVIANA